MKTKSKTETAIKKLSTPEGLREMLAGAVVCLDDHHETERDLEWAKVMNGVVRTGTHILKLEKGA